MRFTTLSKALLIFGAFVGTLAGVAMALGLRLEQLPPWMITVGMYKLAFIAAAASSSPVPCLDAQPGEVRRDRRR